MGALTVIFVIVNSSNPARSARDLRIRNHALIADRKNMHAALLRFLAYFLTIQLDENITR